MMEFAKWAVMIVGGFFGIALLMFIAGYFWTSGIVHAYKDKLDKYVVNKFKEGLNGEEKEI